jgi:molybdopterin-guanine dinucleotide biosynthesis protein A
MMTDGPGSAFRLCMPNASSKDHPPTLGLILAGGQARRMGGGDKAFIGIGGVPILQRVVERLRFDCAGIVINANGDPSRFARFGLPVVPDSVADFPGPLAGVLAGLDFAAIHAPDTAWIVSTPGDCPFLPHDLVPRLHEARQAANARLACARSGDWRHPVAALWPVALREELRQALVVEGLHKIEVWTARYGVVVADWPTQPIDPFFNVNTPEDVVEAERLARGETAHDAGISQ